MSSTVQDAHLGSSPEDYARLGIRPHDVAPWEDGARTTGARGTYEWWYFDSHLDDGSKLVIVFLTKALVAVGRPLTPLVQVFLDRADGTHFEKEVRFPAAAYHAATDGCDVQIGANRFAGDLQTYRIHVALDGVVCDVTLTGTVPAWRPETGYLLFGPAGEHYFAWLPAVPQGTVTATITLAGQTEQRTGSGYHDHNWGNRGIADLVHDWYWARGQIGPYTLIASFITAERRYGYATFPIFMLAHEGRVIADDARRVAFTAEDIRPDPETHKPVAQRTRYVYEDDGARFVLTFDREQTILRMKLVETLPRVTGLLARLVRFDGAFLRFTGRLTLERHAGDAPVETQDAPAIWEEMYFGRTRDPAAGQDAPGRPASDVPPTTAPMPSSPSSPSGDSG